MEMKTVDMSDKSYSAKGEAMLYSQRNDGNDSVDTEDLEQENGPTKNPITFSTSSLPEIKKAPEVSAMTKGCICVIYMFVS